MTYDDVPALAEFAETRQIAYPLLSDKGGVRADSLGIRNERYAEDHPAYGIAHPGIFFIDSDGRHPPEAGTAELSGTAAVSGTPRGAAGSRGKRPRGEPLAGALAHNATAVGTQGLRML